MTSIAKLAAAKEPTHDLKIDRRQSNSAEIWNVLSDEGRTKSFYRDDSEKKERKAKQNGIFQRRFNDARQDKIMKSFEVDPKGKSEEKADEKVRRPAHASNTLSGGDIEKEGQRGSEWNSRYEENTFSNRNSRKLARKEERLTQQDKQRHERKREWRKIQRRQGVLPPRSSLKPPLPGVPHEDANSLLLQKNSKEAGKSASHWVLDESLKQKAPRRLLAITHLPLTNNYSHSVENETISSALPGTVEEIPASSIAVSKNEATNQQPCAALPTSKIMGLHPPSNLLANRSLLTFPDNNATQNKEDDTVLEPLEGSARGATRSTVLSEHLRFSVLPLKDTAFMQRLKNAHLKNKTLRNNNPATSSIPNHSIEPGAIGKPSRRSGGPEIKQLPLNRMGNSTGNEEILPVFSEPEDLVAHKSVQNIIEREPKIAASRDRTSWPNQRRSQSNPPSAPPSRVENCDGDDNNEPVKTQQKHENGDDADVQDKVSQQPPATLTSLPTPMAAISIPHPSRTSTLPGSFLPITPLAALIAAHVPGSPQYGKENIFKCPLDNAIGLQEDMSTASQDIFDATKLVEVINLVDSEGEGGEASAPRLFGLQPIVQYGIAKPTQDLSPISCRGTLAPLAALTSSHVLVSSQLEKNNKCKSLLPKLPIDLEKDITTTSQLGSHGATKSIEFIDLVDFDDESTAPWTQDMGNNDAQQSLRSVEPAETGIATVPSTDPGKQTSLNCSPSILLQPPFTPSATESSPVQDLAATVAMHNEPKSDAQTSKPSEKPLSAVSTMFSTGAMPAPRLVAPAQLISSTPSVADAHSESRDQSPQALQGDRAFQAYQLSSLSSPKQVKPHSRCKWSSITWDNPRVEVDNDTSHCILCDKQFSSFDKLRNHLKADSIHCDSSITIAYEADFSGCRILADKLKWENCNQSQTIFEEVNASGQRTRIRRSISAEDTIKPNSDGAINIQNRESTKMICFWVTEDDVRENDDNTCLCCQEHFATFTDLRWHIADSTKSDHADFRVKITYSPDGQCCQIDVSKRHRPKDTESYRHGFYEVFPDGPDIWQTITSARSSTYDKLKRHSDPSLLRSATLHVPHYEVKNVLCTWKFAPYHWGEDAHEEASDSGRCVICLKECKNFKGLRDHLMHENAWHRWCVTILYGDDPLKAEICLENMPTLGLFFERKRSAIHATALHLSGAKRLPYLPEVEQPMSSTSYHAQVKLVYWDMDVRLCATPAVRKACDTYECIACNLNMFSTFQELQDHLMHDKEHENHAVLFAESRGDGSHSIKLSRTHSTKRPVKVKALRYRPKPQTAPVSAVPEHIRNTPIPTFHPRSPLTPQDLAASHEALTAPDNPLAAASLAIGASGLGTLADRFGSKEAGIWPSHIGNTTTISITPAVIENPMNSVECGYMRPEPFTGTYKEKVASLSKAPRSHGDVGTVSGFSQIGHPPLLRRENHQQFKNSDEVTKTPPSSSKSPAESEPSNHADDTQVPRKPKCKCGKDVVEWNVVYCANGTSRKRKCPYPVLHLLCSDADTSLNGRIRQGEWFCEECRKNRWSRSESSADDGTDNLDDDDDRKEYEQSDVQVAINYIDSTSSMDTTRIVREKSPNAQPRKKQRTTNDRAATAAPDIILPHDANSDPSSTQAAFNLPALSDAAPSVETGTPAPCEAQFRETMRHANDEFGPEKDFERARLDMITSPANALSTDLSSSHAAKDTLNAQNPTSAASGMNLRWLPPGQWKTPRHDYGPCCTCNATKSSKWHKKLNKEAPPGDGKVWCLKCYQKDSSAKKRAATVKSSRPRTMLSKKRDLIEGQMNAAFKKFHELRGEDAPQEEIDAQDLAVKELMKTYKQLQADLSEVTAEETR